MYKMGSSKSYENASTRIPNAGASHTMIVFLYEMRRRWLSIQVLMHPLWSGWLRALDKIQHHALASIWLIFGVNEPIELQI